MTTAGPGPALRVARVACLLASIILLLAAVLGALVWWQQVPSFPPPAANQTLLVLRRVALVVLGAAALISVVWAVRPQLVPVAGIGVHAVAVMVSVVLIALLRGEQAAALFAVPALAAGVAGLAIVWAGLLPAAGPRSATASAGRR